MSLIIALFLIIILLCRVVNDKSKEAEYDRKKKQRDYAVAAWEDRYTSKSLEEKLKCCIENIKDYEEVAAEVSAVLSEMKHWKHLTVGGLDLHYGIDVYMKGRDDRTVSKNRKIALDIMMANRGKITRDGAFWGYKGYIKGRSFDEMERDFEYAETLLYLLRARGVNVELVYSRNNHAYVWKGSWRDNGDVLRFDRVLFDPPVEKIPPPILPVNKEKG